MGGLEVGLLVLLVLLALVLVLVLVLVLQQTLREHKLLLGCQLLLKGAWVHGQRRSSYDWQRLAAQQHSCT